MNSKGANMCLAKVSVQCSADTLVISVSGLYETSP